MTKIEILENDGTGKALDSLKLNSLVGDWSYVVHQINEETPDGNFSLSNGEAKEIAEKLSPLPAVEYRDPRSGKTFYVCYPS